jgi:ribosomal protein L40E
MVSFHLVERMKLEESLSKGFNYTGKLFSRAWDLILLTIITIIPIVNILTLGYVGRVTRDSSSSEGPPRLERWWSMFVDGLKVIAAGILWAIPIAIVAAVLTLALLIPTISLLRLTSPDFWTNWGTNFANSTMGNWTHMGELMQRAFEPIRPLALAIIPVILLVALVIIFTMVMAFTGIVHMFKKGSFVKAFAIGEIFTVMGKIGYLRYLGFIAVMIVLGGVIGIISMIPVLGWIIGAFLSLLLYVAIFRSIGLLYDDAMGTGVIPAATVMPPPIAPVASVAPVVEEKAPPAAPAVAPEAAKAAKIRQVYCVSCGTANPVDGKFCRNCGKELVKS